MIRRWRELLLSSVALALALIVAEMAFRFYLRQRAQAELRRVEAASELVVIDSCKLGDIIRIVREPDLYYELKAKLRGRYCGGATTTNSLGMRMASEPALQKPPLTLRVIGIGDSYLFGQGVDDGQTFLKLVERDALADGRRVETLNFGVPGYNTWMEAAVLATRAAKYAPDVIVVSVMGNDWELPSFMMSRPYTSPRQSFLFGALGERLRARHAVLDTPRSTRPASGFFALPEEVPAEFAHMVGYTAYRRGLSRMLQTAHELGARLVFFSDCLAPPGDAGCSFPFMAGQYERLKREVYDDSAVELCPWQLPAELLIPRDGHPTVQGHVRLAAELRRCLTRITAP